MRNIFYRQVRDDYKEFAFIRCLLQKKPRSILGIKFVSDYHIPDSAEVGRFTEIYLNILFMEFQIW